MAPGVGAWEGAKERTGKGTREEAPKTDGREPHGQGPLSPDLPFGPCRPLRAGGQASAPDARDSATEGVGPGCGLRGPCPSLPLLVPLGLSPSSPSQPPLGPPESPRGPPALGHCSLGLSLPHLCWASGAHSPGLPAEALLVTAVTRLARYLGNWTKKLVKLLNKF